MISLGYTQHISRAETGIFLTDSVFFGPLALRVQNVYHNADLPEEEEDE